MGPDEEPIPRRLKTSVQGFFRSDYPLPPGEGENERSAFQEAIKIFSPNDQKILTEKLKEHLLERYPERLKIETHTPVFVVLKASWGILVLSDDGIFAVVQERDLEPV